MRKSIFYKLFIIILIFLINESRPVPDVKAGEVFNFSPRKKESLTLNLKRKEEKIPSIKSLYMETKQKFRDGDYDAAITGFIEVIKLEKDIAPFYTPFAKEYIGLAKEKEQIEAEEAFIKGLKRKRKESARRKEEEELKKESREKEKMVKIENAYKEAREDYLKTIAKFEKVIDLEEKLGLVSATRAKEFRDYLSQKEGELKKPGLGMGVIEQKREPKILEYTIGDGDVLYISVWQEETLSQEVIVRPDGRISFPLVGDVPAVGLTFSELSEELTKKLNEYIKVPVVSISLRKLGGKKVIVLGEVKVPGVYSVTGGRTVLEAIALANGFTEDAVLSSVIVIQGGLQNPKGMRINLDRAINKLDMSQNIVLQPEDIIYVPRKFIANINYYLEKILVPVSRGVYIADSAMEW